MYYINFNLNSSIICCLFSGGMYIFLDISCVFSVCISVFYSLEVFCDIVLVILSSLYDLASMPPILIPINSLIASAVFLIALFEAVLSQLHQIF